MDTMILRNGRPVIGFGDTGDLSSPAVAAVAAASPWAVVLATSVVSAATGWVLEEVAEKVRKKRR